MPFMVGSDDVKIKTMCKYSKGELSGWFTTADKITYDSSGTLGLLGSKAHKHIKTSQKIDNMRKQQ